uniref:Uncharacterized protein TCIL3000_11_16570 n=1 Tax=Trypanosoma congolense (strain IL3000) TaxID=1068625 RepID=G0V3C2_TRYCI|nr:unnamed protein product [Trypanosoma congolense IL3000]
MLLACGIEKFRVQSEHPATARLKQIPEDFVVVEVDPEGERTDAPAYKLPAPRATAAAPLEACSDSTHSTPPIVTPPSGADSVPDMGPSSMSMEDLLGNGLRDTLQGLFGSKSEAVAMYITCVDRSDFSFATKECNIGFFDQKGKRERLHRALKAEFPYLRGETRRRSHSKGTVAPSADNTSGKDGVGIHAHGDGSNGAHDYHVVVTYDSDFLQVAYLFGEVVADAIWMWSFLDTHDGPLHLTAEFPAGATKETRRSFHEMMARRHPKIMCRVSNGRLSIRGIPGRQEKRQRNVRDGSASHFTHFLVRKRNLDMMELRILLAEHFHVPVDTVCTAGLKDKRAVAYQRCSIPRTSWQPCQEGGDKVLHLIWPGDPTSYVEILEASGPHTVPVAIGELRGNMFTIHLRDVRGMSPSQMTQRVRQIETQGFLNYFGQQRFSENTKCVTDHVGVHILAGRWPEAVRCLLSGVPGLYNSFPARMELRHVPATSRDAQCIVQALSQLHRSKFAALTEADVLGCTGYWKELCYEALHKVPYAFRALWLHAAQGLIFNRALSKLSGPGLPAVLPLLGYGVTLEDGILETLGETLAELGLGPLDNFVQQRKVLGVAMPGAMRATVVRPVNCSLLFDAADGAKDEGFSVTLSFFLPPSSYATIFLREVLGCDTWW